MKCLITGGAGFIGSNLANTLSKTHTVTVVDNLSEGKREFIPGINLIENDFDSRTVLSMIEDREFDYVFHLAAKPKVEYSVQHPFDSNNTNVNKTVKLLEACRGNIKRFINTSSSSVYGNINPNSSSSEIDKLSPTSPYALQKHIIEQYCSLFSNIYNLETVSIRPFNVFGPNQLGNSSYSCLISAWLYAIKHDLPLRFDGDGLQSRDYIYVDNLVDIFIKAALHEQPLYGEVFNGGSEISISNLGILDWFKTSFPKLKVTNAPARENDVLLTRSSTIKTRNMLHSFQPISFHEGFNRTKDWALNSDLF